MFDDRIDAGRQLAAALDRFKTENPVVLGIPRGGVIVAAEVAELLGCAFDLIIPRKVGAPGNPELAIGAVAGEGRVILNEDLVADLNVSRDYLDERVREETEEIRRRRRLYLGDRAPVNISGRTVLIVDDGLATGYTALAAISVVRLENPAKTILAVPVGPKRTVFELSQEVDELICLSTPEPFFAVGQFYANFSEVTDVQVTAKLKEVRAA